jgi:hypothetical protein
MSRVAGVRNFHNGTYHIAGTTTCSGSLVARTVYLLYHNSTYITPATVIAVQSTVAGVGAFDFRYLQAGNYTVIAVDPAGLEDDVIHTNIAAVAM